MSAVKMFFVACRFVINWSQLKVILKWAQILLQWKLQVSAFYLYSFLFLMVKTDLKKFSKTVVLSLVKTNAEGHAKLQNAYCCGCDVFESHHLQFCSRSVFLPCIMQFGTNVRIVALYFCQWSTIQERCCRFSYLKFTNKS